MLPYLDVQDVHVQTHTHIKLFHTLCFHFIPCIHWPFQHNSIQYYRDGTSPYKKLDKNKIKYFWHTHTSHFTVKMRVVCYEKCVFENAVLLLMLVEYKLAKIGIASESKIKCTMPGMLMVVLFFVNNISFVYGGIFFSIESYLLVFLNVSKRKMIYPSYRCGIGPLIDEFVMYYQKSM